MGVSEMKYTMTRKDLIKAAKLYYYGNMSQDEIAAMMHISRPKVSRMLSAARSLNIVQITIKDPVFSLTDMATKIKNYFSLKNVVVVPAGQNLEEAKDNIGSAASEMLNRIVFNGMKVGISWGTTLNSFVNRYHCSKSYPDTKIVQLIGGMYQQTMHMDGRELVKNLALKMGAQYQLLQTPLMVHNPELKVLLMQEPENIEHFKLIDSLDAAFVGLGSSNYKNTVIYKAKYLEASDAKHMSDTGLFDICGHQIDSEGNEPPSPVKDRVIGISLHSLQRIPQVFAVCAGNEKVPAICAAIRGGYINSLIIDEIAALSLMETENIQ